MSKIFETNFENGSFIDKVSGISPLFNTNVIITKDSKFALTRNGSSCRLAYNLYHVGQQAYSFEIWVKELKQTGNNNGYLSTAGTTYGTDKGIGIFDVGDGTIYFGVYTGSGGILIASTSKVKKGVWNHLVFTWPGLTNTKVNFYINGVLDKSANVSGSWTGQSTWPMNVNCFGGTGQTTNSRIAKGILYNHILSQKEITEGYVKMQNTQAINRPTIFQPNLSVLKPTEVIE